MGSYTIIADVSRSIVEMLRKTMIPEPIQKEEEIGLCSPNDRGNHILGIYLYDLDENPEKKEDIWIENIIKNRLYPLICTICCLLTQMRILQIVFMMNKEF